MTTMKRRAERTNEDWARRMEVRRARQGLVEFYATGAALILGGGLMIYWFGG